MLLTAADKIQAVLSEATTTTEGDFVAWYFDSGATPTGSRKLTNSSGTTAVDIVGSPATSYVRQVKGLTYRNKDTITHGVTFYYHDGSTQWRLSPAISVPAGYSVEWSDANGFMLITTGGLALAMPSLPLSVAQGGTGLTTLTAHALYAGNGTSAPTPISVGATGTILVGSTGADPSFSSTAAIGDGSASTPSHTFSSDLDTGLYRVGANNPAMAAGGSQLMAWSASGNTQPLQPAFTARLNASVTGVTGDSTEYTVIFDAEYFDQGGDFDTSTGTFTAPQTGIYFFGGTVLLDTLGSGHTMGWLILTAGGTSYYGSSCNPYAIKRSDGYAGLILPPTLAYMTASQTAILKAKVAGSTKTVDINGSSGTAKTYFSGALLF